MQHNFTPLSNSLPQAGERTIEKSYCQSSQLVVVRNPFDRTSRDERNLLLDTMPTVAEVVRDYLPLSDSIAISVNGELITRDEWATRQLRQGEQMVVMPQIHDSPKQILGTILMIVLIVYAPAMAASIAGASSGVGYSLALMGVMMVGSRLIGGLTAPNQPALPGSTNTSQSYGWNPATTQQPGGVVPRAYGRNKLYGNIIAGYIEQTGDTGQNQTAHLLIDLGCGPYSQLTDFKINGQPIGYYHGVTVTTRMGNVDQKIIPAFNDTKLTRPVAVKLTKDTAVIRETEGADYDALEIVLVCPNGLWYANDHGGLDALPAYVTVEISGDGGATWWDVEVEPRTYTAEVIQPDRWSLGSWRQIREDESYTTRWYESRRGSTVRSDHNEGDQGWITSDDNAHGNLYWRWIDVTTTAATDVTVSDSITLTGTAQQPIRRTLTARNLTRGTQYLVRCTKLSDDYTSSRYSADVYLGELNEVMYDDFQYPRTVLVAVEALATDQISGSISFSCMADCAIVRVYDGANWSSVYSNNPAWVCWDILTQPVLELLYGDTWEVVRYDGLDPSRLDLFTFKVWADFCDTLVPDGRGGTEKRCLFDGIFDTQTSMWDAALEVCASARAQLVMRGTRVAVVVDDVRTVPVQLFTVGNTAESGFNETFLPMQDRAAAIEVSYVNSEKEYARDTLTVVNTAISEDAAARTQIALRGVTRESQAWREANYRLKRNELLRRSASINVDIDALACTVGDMVWLQSDVTRWGVGGRAAAGSTTTSLALDQAVTLDAGTAYELKLRLSDDTLVTRTITTAAGTVSVVEVSAAFPSAPALYDVWALGETGKAIKEFLVIDITRAGDQKAKLSLIEYNASLYGLDSGLPALSTPDAAGTTDYIPIAVPECYGLRIEEAREDTADGGQLVHLDLYFSLLNTAGAKVLEGGQLIGESTTGQIRRQNVMPGTTYDFTVCPYGFYGESPRGTWKSISHTVSVVNPIVPAVIGTAEAASSMRYQITDTDTEHIFSVVTISDPNIIGYELRYGSSFETGTLLEQNTTGIFTVAKEDAGGKTFYVRAKYLSGGYSAAEVVITTNDPVMPLKPANLSWRVSEPDLVWSWDASPDAVSYLIYWEDGGVARKIEQTGTSVSVPIPRWASALLRIYAISEMGVQSKAVEEEITINGRYVYNEVVNTAVPLSTGTYVNMCHYSANVVMKPSILGVTPSLPISDANDSDLYTLGYNWTAGAISSFASTPVAYFRDDFWKEESGYFESAVIDLGAIYTGILMLNLTKNITDYGSQGLSVYGHALVEYLSDRPISSLVDAKAFLSARFMVATDSANSSNWKNAQSGDTVSVRYCKVVVEALHVSPLTACSVTAGTIYIDVPDISESGKATGVTTGNTVINLVKPFKAITTAMATARGAAKAEVVGTSIGSPCTLTIKTNSATPSDVDWFVKGY